MGNLMNWKKSVPVSIKYQRSPFARLQTSFDKAMDELWEMMDGYRLLTRKNTGEDVLEPDMDVVDDNKSFRIAVEMPGVGVGDISVSITDNILTLKAEKKISKEDKDKNYLMKEISYGYYERNIPLPDSVDIDKAKASFKGGMLSIEVPKKVECIKKSRDIKVENVDKAIN